jgi:hypothetical protein
MGNVTGHRAGVGASEAGQESGVDGLAPATRELIDTEARRIIEECYLQ